MLLDSGRASGQQDAKKSKESVKPDCVLEDWNHEASVPGFFTLNGSATCEKGSVSFRVHDGDTDEFVTSGFGFVRGFVFSVVVQGNAPSNMSFRYVIE